MEWEDVLKIPATSPKQKIHRELVLQMSKTNHFAQEKREGAGASKEREHNSE